MFGFILGTVCLVALIATIRRARWGYGYGGGCGHRGWGGGGCHHRHHGGGWGGGWGGPPWARGGFDDHGPDFGQRDRGRGFGFGGRGGFVMRFLSERLDASPAQEKVIAQAIDEMREAIGKAKDGFKASRGDVANAVRGDNFDVSHVGALFSKHDDAIDGVRKAFVSAMQKVHDALDERQRKILADIIEAGPGGFFGGDRGGGPWGGYRDRGGW